MDQGRAVNHFKFRSVVRVFHTVGKYCSETSLREVSRQKRSRASDGNDAGSSDKEMLGREGCEC